MICLGSAQTFIKSQGHSVPMQTVLLPQTPCPPLSPSPRVAAASLDLHILSAGIKQRREDTASLSSAGVAAFNGVKG